MHILLSVIAMPYILLALVTLALVISLWTHPSNQGTRLEQATSLKDEHAVDAIDKGQADPEERAGDPGRTDAFLSQLSGAERGLVLELARRSASGGTVDIDTVNRMLGLSGKRVELQKAYRSRAISHINAMHRTTYGMHDDLLERVRNPEDRRSYEYRMSAEHAARILRNSSY